MQVPVAPAPAPAWVNTTTRTLACSASSRGVAAVPQVAWDQQRQQPIRMQSTAVLQAPHSPEWAYPQPRTTPLRVSISPPASRRQGSPVVGPGIPASRRPPTTARSLSPVHITTTSPRLAAASSPIGEQWRMTRPSGSRIILPTRPCLGGHPDQPAANVEVARRQASRQTTGTTSLKRLTSSTVPVPMTQTQRLKADGEKARSPHDAAYLQNSGSAAFLPTGGACFTHRGKLGAGLMERCSSSGSPPGGPSAALVSPTSLADTTRLPDTEADSFCELPATPSRNASRTFSSMPQDSPTSFVLAGGDQFRRGIGAISHRRLSTASSQPGSVCLSPGGRGSVSVSPQLTFRTLTESTPSLSTASTTILSAVSASCAAQAHKNRATVPCGPRKPKVAAYGEANDAGSTKVQLIEYDRVLKVVEEKRNQLLASIAAERAHAEEASSSNENKDINALRQKRNGARTLARPSFSPAAVVRRLPSIDEPPVELEGILGQLQEPGTARDESPMGRGAEWLRRAPANYATRPPDRKPQGRKKLTLSAPNSARAHYQPVPGEVSGGGGAGSIGGGVVGNSREVGIMKEEAQRICSMEDVEELLQLGLTPRNNLWMIFQVHRVLLNDPSLTLLDFSKHTLPAAEREPRIVHKLFDALGDNTHLRVLRLNGCRLEGGHTMEILASSLRRNRTLNTLELENNCFSGRDLMILFANLASFPSLEVLRLVNQHDQRGVSDEVFTQCGEVGIPAWRTLAEALNRNKSLKTLGFYLSEADPGSRDIINKALIRNTDAIRRRRLLVGE